MTNIINRCILNVYLCVVFLLIGYNEKKLLPVAVCAVAIFERGQKTATG